VDAYTSPLYSQLCGRTVYCDHRQADYRAVAYEVVDGMVLAHCD
jgi:hypothetical protein